MNYQVQGKAIEDYTAKHNISAYEFCKTFGIHTSTYDKIIRGEKVKLTTLFVLAHKIGLSLKDFLA